MLKVTKSRLVNDSTPETMKEQDFRIMWQALLAEANEIVAILQSWKPRYFETVDPMLSYIIFLGACILILNDKVDVALDGPRSSNHIDVALLFLSQVGQFWPIGAHFPTMQSLFIRKTPVVVDLAIVANKRKVRASKVRSSHVYGY